MKHEFKRLIGSLFSRRVIIYSINKIVAINLIWMLSSPLYQSIVFGISSIFDLVIINELNFNNIDTNIEIKR